MAKPKEISKEDYRNLIDKLWRRALKLYHPIRQLPWGERYKIDSGSFKWGLFFSGTFDLCGTPINEDKVYNFLEIYDKLMGAYNNYHFVNVPCTCKETNWRKKYAICLLEIEEKYYVCRHRVGNCPWKTPIFDWSDE